ncbi:uncharacterized protein AB675_206 [Cyphellophora attinorum]|uniref:tRNA A64-2'-O-ribosylphosphate transferase n=1 Tax=Cyphellophora attinorum TaxID=1664694 RepID=A0A0N1HLE4_9EURO|nr:uncharacterized protein AB675_206 [Phialophora attinorum]KPI37814.1 hypothetical protein AB675_206 [Phialophora attinorum]
MTEGLDTSDSTDEEEEINTANQGTLNCVPTPSQRPATANWHIYYYTQVKVPNIAVRSLRRSLQLISTLALQNPGPTPPLNPLPPPPPPLHPAGSHFITRLHHHTSLPLISNERCGSWYIPPALKSGSAYFKSTDGHVGQWAFSLRRLNLELLKVLGREGGAALVDSTRRGKAMPDALRRTVVIWVAVVNRVLFGEGVEVQTLEGEEGLTRSERRLVEGRVEGWCKDFRKLGLDIEALREMLKRPVRCVWAVNGTWDFEQEFDKGTYASAGQNVLVLASASRRVRGAEMSEGGYIQGAADDAEGWSRGLTASLWWENSERLLAADAADVEGMIDKIVLAQKLAQLKSHGGEIQIRKAPFVFIAKGPRADACDWDLIIDCHGKDETWSEDKKVLHLRCREGKLGSKDLREKITMAVAAGRAALVTGGSRILITCSKGTDLSVGVALALICMLYDDNGQILTPDTDITRLDHIDKLMVKKRLAWITESKPDANPSRATMQAVNSFLMERPR